MLILALATAAPDGSAADPRTVDVVSCPIRRLQEEKQIVTHLRAERGISPPLRNEIARVNHRSGEGVKPLGKLAGEPRAGKVPIALQRGDRYIQRLSGFSLTQSAKKAQFNRFRSPFIERLQTGERFIDGQ